MIEALSWAVVDELEGHTLRPVIRMRLITYAGASGDFTPIHLVDEAAKEAGLPGIIPLGCSQSPRWAFCSSPTSNTAT